MEKCRKYYRNKLLAKKLTTKGKRECAKCLKVKLHKEFYKVVQNKDGFSSYCRMCLYKKNYVWRVKQKQDAMNVYGNGKCYCCGETNLEFLTIEHSRRDGQIQRARSKTKGVYYYHHLKKLGFPKNLGLKVLCMNCNTAYGHWGYCPHEKRKKK